jgi:hypothetical protein
MAPHRRTGNSLTVSGVVRVDISNCPPAVAYRKLGSLKLFPFRAPLTLYVGALAPNVDLIQRIQAGGQHIVWTNRGGQPARRRPLVQSDAITRPTRRRRRNAQRAGRIVTGPSFRAAPTVAASPEVLQHHCEMHGIRCPEGEPVEVVCDDGQASILACSACGEAVVVLIAPGAECQHAVEVRQGLLPSGVWSAVLR